MQNLTEENHRNTMAGAGKEDIYLPHQRQYCEARTTTTIANINATLVNNLAILADIQRKIDILSEILADQGDPHGHRQPQHGSPSS